MAFVRRRLRKVKPRINETKPDKDGNVEKLHKHCFMKVIVQDKVQPHKFVAPAGNGYSEKDIDEIREKVVDYLDKRFPHFDFREVQIAANAFNYIATGLRGDQSPQEFMNEQAKRFDPEAFVASVRASKGPGAELLINGGATVFTENKSNDESSGAAAGGTDGSSEDRSESAEATSDSKSPDSCEPAAGGDSQRSVQEPGPLHPRDQEHPDSSV
jgi:hypothetical protein